MWAARYLLRRYAAHYLAADIIVYYKTYLYPPRTYGLHRAVTSYQYYMEVTAIIMSQLRIMYGS